MAAFLQALLAQGRAQAAVTDLERSVALSPPGDQAVMREVLNQARAALPADSAQVSRRTSISLRLQAESIQVQHFHRHLQGMSR